MDKIVLPCQARSDMKAKFLRREKLIPAVCYGVDDENVSLQIDYNTFVRVFNKAGFNTVVELTFDEGNKKIEVMIHDVDMNPVTDDYTHIDFMKIDKNQPITASVPLTFANFAPAVKDEGGILMHIKDEVEIKCLPDDLIHEIEVDLSPLVEMNSKITVAELKVPSTVELMEDPESVVLQVTAPKIVEEEEEIAPVEGEEGAEGAEGAAEGEEGAEGAEGEKAEGEGEKEG